MLFMLFKVLGENEDVINVIDHKIIPLFIKKHQYEVLKHGKCICKAKGDHSRLGYQKGMFN
jgi:uncharacterized protein (DUF779 family)